jgi:hypothetical protein
MIGRKGVLVLGLVLAGSACPRAAVARAKSGRAPQSFEVDLDTQEEEFSYWRMNGIDSSDGLRAAAKIMRFGKSRRWMPTFMIQLSSGSGESAEFWRVRWVPEKTGGPQSLVLIRSIGAKEVNVAKFDRKFVLNDSFPVEISWSGPAKMIVRVGNETREVPRSLRPSTLDVSGSSGEFKLAALVLHPSDR